MAKNQSKHDWVAIRIKFVQSNDSLREFCKKDNLNYSVVQAHYSKMDWEGERDQYRIKVISKTEDELASRAATDLVKLYESWDKLRAALEKELEKNVTLERIKSAAHRANALWSSNSIGAMFS